MPATVAPGHQPEAQNPDPPLPAPATAGQQQALADSGTVSTAPAPGYHGTFSGRAEEAARVRREIAEYLGDCPVTDDIVLIADELAANSIVHSRSRGASFGVRCQLSPGAARIEVEDMGGPWRPRTPSDRPHGLNIIQALTGHDGWGTQPNSNGHRLTWAQMSW